MVVSFASKELAQLCSSGTALEQRYGPVRATVVRQRLFEIAGAPSPELLFMLPCFGCVRATEQERPVIIVPVDEGLSIVLEEVSTSSALPEIRIVQLRD